MKYLGSCVSCPDTAVQHLVKMVESGRAISWRTFRRNIGKSNYDELASHLGYLIGYAGLCGELRLETDYAVSFHKGKYRGQTAYWCEHSCIEYIYTAKAEY
jgi:hypothetical protein